jgi:hypothetical protein
MAAGISDIQKAQGTTNAKTSHLSAGRQKYNNPSTNAPSRLCFFCFVLYLAFVI